MMNITTKVSVLVAAAVLAGCAAKPVITGDSAPQQKNATFPKAGQQVHVVTGGLVHLRADYTSRFGYHLKQPISMGFGLGRLNVSNEDMLVAATLQEKPVFCTTRKTYSDPLVGAIKPACFVEAEKGNFSQVKVAPGEYWFTKDLTPSIPFVGNEVPLSNSGKILKRELVFEGQQNGSLFFTEKQYEFNLDTPSKAKPVLSKVDAAPAQINLNGAVINVIAFTANSLTFSLEKAWD